MKRTARNTDELLTPAIPSKVLMAFSSRNFIVFSSRSVHAASSTSMFFEVEGADDDGKGKIKSLKTCSAMALSVQYVLVSSHIQKEPANENNSYLTS